MGLDIVQLHMEQEIVQCHDIEAAEEICMDFRRKIATYSESEFQVNIFIADTSVQTSTVSVRVFCGPTMCRARGNEISAMNRTY